MRHAQREGHCVIDLAAPNVFDIASSGTGFDEDPAYDLALLAGLAREATFARGADANDAAERAREVLERLLPRETVEPVRVRVEGPRWLDTSRWDGEVTSARARWVLRELDGLAVGGTMLRVHVDPPVRAGRAAPPWRPRNERRRELFSRWDRGIRADDEGLFSATPEALAECIAKGAHGIVIDGTCGIGSIAIALAQRPEVRKVIAVDIDRERLEMAAHNARIYDVAHRIHFVHGDVREVIAREQADVLVLDPPWGGRDYDRMRVALDDLAFDIRPLIARFEGAIVLKLPRSFDVSTLPKSFAIEPGIDARGIIKMLIARAML
jgi:trimethylguanosine synthase